MNFGTPREPSTNIHPVESIEPDLSVSGLEEASRCFRRVWMWAARSNDPRAIGVRHLTSSWLMGHRPDIRTEAQLGRLCGVTRAAVSKISTDFRLTFGVNFAMQNGDANRDKCRQNRFRTR